MNFVLTLLENCTNAQRTIMKSRNLMNAILNDSGVEMTKRILSVIENILGRSRSVEMRTWCSRMLERIIHTFMFHSLISQEKSLENPTYKLDYNEKTQNTGTKQQCISFSLFHISKYLKDEDKESFTLDFLRFLFVNKQSSLLRVDDRMKLSVRGVLL